MCLAGLANVGLIRRKTAPDPCSRPTAFHASGTRLMPTIPEAFAIALRHHQAGRLHQAEPMYGEILAADPNHHDAWHLLGVIACQGGKPQAGVECIQRALTHRPDWPERNTTWETPGRTWAGWMKPWRVISESCN